MTLMALAVLPASDHLSQIILGDREFNDRGLFPFDFETLT